jgi:ethanolaminephosphotransferase
MSVIGRNITLESYICLGATTWVNIFIPHDKFYADIIDYIAGMWGSVAIYAVNYIFGAEMWKVPLSANGLSCGHFLEAVLHCGALSNLPMVFWNLYRSYKDKTGKMRNFTECMRPLMPLFLFFAISLLWAHKSPNRIVETDPRAVFFLTGTIFSNISCRLIVSQMSNTTSETFHWMTPILAVCFVFSLIIPRLERVLLYALLIFSSAAHWHYGTGVVQQMCVHFNRICFGVGKRTDEPKKD